MDCKEIIGEFLEKNGYSGLCNTDAQCGCELYDIIPCEGNISECQPGYKHMDPRPDHKGQFAVFNSKEIEESDWEDIEY